MGNQPAPWATGPGSHEGSATAPQPPRPLNPETGEPVPDLTLWQRVALSTIGSAGRAFIERWLPRQLLKVLTVASGAIGASESDTVRVVSWLICGVSFLFELMLSRASRRFLKLKS